MKQQTVTSFSVLSESLTMIGEDQANPLNQKLLPYNAFLKQLAKDKKCLLADLNTDMQDALKTTFRPEFLNRVDDIVVFHSLTLE